MVIHLPTALGADGDSCGKGLGHGGSRQECPPSAFPPERICMHIQNAIPDRRSFAVVGAVTKARAASLNFGPTTEDGLKWRAERGGVTAP
jgi:hypothetical protein